DACEKLTDMGFDVKIEPEQRFYRRRIESGLTFTGSAGINPMAPDQAHDRLPDDNEADDRRLIERMRDDFVSVVSHELLTPLATMRLQSEGLLRLVSKPAPLPVDQARLRLRGLVAQIDRLEQLLRGLLDVSRI